MSDKIRDISKLNVDVQKNINDEQKTKISSYILNIQ